MRLQDESVREDECAFADEGLDASQVGPGGGAGVWLRLPLAALRPLLLLAGVLLATCVASLQSPLADGLGALVRRAPALPACVGLAAGACLWAVARRLRAERWRGDAVDRLTLCLPLLGSVLCALAPLAPVLLIAGALLLFGGALLLLPWHWQRRAERAWLLHKPGYGRALLGMLVTLVALPVLAALGLRTVARHTQARVEQASRVWSAPGADCLARLLQAAPGSVADRLALAAFGPRLGGRPGQALFECLAPELQETETLAQRLTFDPDRLCQPLAEPGNSALFATWHARRDRLLQAHWLIAALDPASRREYDAALAAQAEAASACGDPWLLPEALLFDAADAAGALGGCGARWATAAHEEWVHQALLRWRQAALPQAFTGEQFPLAGRAFFTRRHEAATGAGYVQTEPVESVALRPAAQGGFEVGLHLRWLRAAQVRAAMVPWMEKRQRGNEIYFNDCAKPAAEKLLDGLRDAWGFANRQRLGTSACPRSFGKAQHHVLPFGGGQAFVVAQYQLVGGTAQARLAYTDVNPCQE